MALHVASYRHYLGTWNAKERVVIDGHAPDDAELASLRTSDMIGDGASLANSEDAIALAMTLPARITKRLWDLDWSEDGKMTPRDSAAFEAYGRSVAAFFRAAGFPLRETFETRLVAAAPGTNALDDLALHVDRPVALVNVGESDAFILMESHRVELRVPKTEGCLLSPKARPYVVVVPADAAFGLFLELA